MSRWSIFGSGKHRPARVQRFYARNLTGKARARKLAARKQSKLSRRTNRGH